MNNWHIWGIPCNFPFSFPIASINSHGLEDFFAANLKTPMRATNTRLEMRGKVLQREIRLNARKTTSHGNITTSWKEWIRLVKSIDIYWEAYGVRRRSSRRRPRWYVYGFTRSCANKYTVIALSDTRGATQLTHFSLPCAMCELPMVRTRTRHTSNGEDAVDGSSLKGRHYKIRKQENGLN